MTERPVAGKVPFLVLALAFAYIALVPVLYRDGLISRVYYLRQDSWSGMAMAILFGALAFRKPDLKLPETMPGRKQVWAMAAGLVLLLWAGTHLIMFNYPLTRDEHMVVFDAGIFASGHLYMPLPDEWAGYAYALVPAFLLDVPENSLLVSAYGPGNALLRAIFTVLLYPSLMNPVLSGIGLIALYRIALRLFPDSPGAMWVCLLGYLLSAQVLVNAMTTYAMTPHLVLNLVWLALFLRGGRWAIAGTMVIGVWAIGLHQVIFHPLFAGPFILTLLPQKRWGLFAGYAAVYGAALLFWVSYPSILMGMAGIVAESGSGEGMTGFIKERVVPLLIERDPYTIQLTFYNVLRYIVWAPLFTIPLAAVAWPLVRERQGIALPLFGGFVLTLVAVLLILPYQGHGWGYRYLHPVLGNAMLLAGYGYRRWASKDPEMAAAKTAAMAGFSALVVLPFLLFTTWQFVKPYADLYALAKRQTADFVIVDTQWPFAAIDVVRNRADLSNTPLILSTSTLKRTQLEELCRRGTITFLTRKDWHSVGFVTGLEEQSPVFERKTDWLKQRDCYRPSN